jgi:hypothetical protein
MFLIRKKKTCCASVHFFDDRGAPSYALLAFLGAAVLAGGVANGLMVASFHNIDSAVDLACKPNKITSWLIKEQCYDQCQLVEYLNEYTVGLKFEGIMGGFLMTQLMFVLALSAQVPTPKGTLGSIGFWIYVLCILLQAIFTLAALVPFYSAYTNASNQKDCFIQATSSDWTLFSASFIFSSAFHPFVMSNLNLFLVHMLLLTQAARVRTIATRDEDISSFWVAEDRWPRRLLLCTYAWPICTAILFVVTIACLFSLAFTPILLLEGPLIALIFLFLAWLHWRTDETGHENRSCLMQAILGSLHGATTAHGAVSTKPPYRDHGGLFYHAALMPVITFTLSTILLPGTLLAWVAFSSGDSSALVRDLYRFHFDLFVSLDLQLPSFKISFELISTAINNLPDLSQPDAWGDNPQQLSSASQGFWSLSVLMSFLKLLLTLGTAAMSLLGYIAPNVPTNKCAGTSNFDIGIVLDHIDDVEEEQQKSIAKCCQCAKRKKQKKMKKKAGFGYFEMS